ncbi:MAG: cytochrome b561 [Paraglaciecola sp.]|jgi:cytochrome b561
MTIKNTAQTYGCVAKWIHWLTVLFFLAAYCSVYYRHWFTEDKTAENWTALQLHLSIGISIAVLVILRIVWKLMNRTPNLEPGTKFEHFTAKSGHLVLYGIMIIMPLTGYFGTGANTEFFFLFDIPKFESTGLFTTLFAEGLGLSFAEFEKPLDFIHKDIGGAWLVWLLILGHAMAALYHHFVKQDRTLIKMTFDK